MRDFLRRLGCRSARIAAMAAMVAMAASCESVDSRRLPALPVTINLSNYGLWNTWGVAAYGSYRTFVRELTLPEGFAYTDRTFTGFGGVLLICGMDPFTTETLVPLAYDLACPVECRSDVRVGIDDSTFEAVCPVCGSHYDVTAAGGSPISGPARDLKYGLQRYTCIPSAIGGYTITR